MARLQDRKVLCPWCGYKFNWPSELVHLIVNDDGDFEHLSDREWSRLDVQQQGRLMAAGRDYREVCPRSTALAYSRPYGRAGASEPALRSEPEPTNLDDEAEADRDPFSLPAVATEAGAGGERDEDGYVDDDEPERAEAMPFVVNERFQGFHELPIGYGRNPVMVVVLAGGTESGKSTLLASLIYHLRSPLADNRRYLDVGFRLRLALDRFGDLDLGDGGLGAFDVPPHYGPLATLGGQGRLVFVRATVEVNDEQLRRYSPGTARVVEAMGRHEANAEGPGRAVDIDVLIIDLPGEAFRDPAQLFQWNAITVHADALIVTQDLMESLDLQTELTGGADASSAFVGGRSTDGTTTVPVTAKLVLDVIREARERLVQAAGDKIPQDVPAALAVTKVDMLEPLLARAGLRNSIHADRVLGLAPLRLDEAHLEDTTRSNFSLLYAYGLHDAAERAIDQFDRVSIHLVSATGNAGEENAGRRKYPDLRPRNVLDPLVTLIWRWAVDRG